MTLVGLFSVYLVNFLQKNWNGQICEQLLLCCAMQHPTASNGKANINLIEIATTNTNNTNSKCEIKKIL